jgi:hypothetical protein
MNESVIHLFGMYLSELIHKPPLACKGFIRFAIKKYNKIHEIPEERPLSYDEFYEIVQQVMRKDLSDAKIANTDDIILKFTQEISLQKAIFSMSI